MSTYEPGLTGNKTYVGTRFGVGTRGKNGRYSKGAASPIEFNGNDQPISDKELLLLPEGERVKYIRKIYTPSELKTANVIDNRSADLVVIDGDSFEIFQVKRWDMGVLDHFEVVAIRVDV